MPTLKPKLTHREQARYLEVAQDLAAEGAKIDVPEEWLKQGCCLRLTIATSPESMIYQLSPSSVLYALRVRLFAERSVAVQEYEIATPFDPDVFACYPDGDDLYRFSRSLDFDFKEVLNHRIDEVLRFRRGDIQEGWLLAMGNRPIPSEYGRRAPVQVRLSAQCCRTSVATVDLVVERSARAKQSAMRFRTDLLEPQSRSEAERRAAGAALYLPVKVNPFSQSVPEMKQRK